MLILQDSSAVPYRPGYYFYAYQSNYELVVTKEEVVFFKLQPVSCNPAGTEPNVNRPRNSEEFLALVQELCVILPPDHIPEVYVSAIASGIRSSSHKPIVNLFAFTSSHIHVHARWL